MKHKKRKATEKDLERCLRLMTKWHDRISDEGWAIAGELCRCKEFDDVVAHISFDSRAHTALLKLHYANDRDRVPLHEQLHLETAAMGAVVQELQWGGITERQRNKACEWYKYYLEIFLSRMTDTLLDMDKEIRRWKRKTKKLEKQLGE